MGTRTVIERNSVAQQGEGVFFEGDEIFMNPLQVVGNDGTTNLKPSHHHLHLVRIMHTLHSPFAIHEVKCRLINAANPKRDVLQVKTYKSQRLCFPAEASGQFGGKQLATSLLNPEILPKEWGSFSNVEIIFSKLATPSIFVGFQQERVHTD